MKVWEATFIKGAVAYELQIGRLWFGLYRPRFMATSGLGFIRITDRD